jgi:heterodisulfide reductase subunit A-like polyferredoxin
MDRNQRWSVLCRFAWAGRKGRIRSRQRYVTLTCGYMDQARAIIIGAGPTGLAAAYELFTRTGNTPIVPDKEHLRGWKFPHGELLHYSLCIPPVSVLVAS